MRAYDVTKLASTSRTRRGEAVGHLQGAAAAALLLLRRDRAKLPKTRLQALREPSPPARRLRGVAADAVVGLRWIHRLEPTLEEGLLLHERARQTSDIKAVLAIGGRDADREVPADTKFAGRALTFSIQDPKIIPTDGPVPVPRRPPRRQVPARRQAFPHYCAVCTMWVYISIVIPHKSKKDKEKEEEEEKKKRRARRVNVKGSLQANQ